MEETHVISVRLPKSIIRDLDNVVNGERYFKRNSLILQVLRVFLRCSDKQTIYDILRWWPHSGDRYELTFRKIDPKQKKEISRESPAV